jgi:putative ABC transport system substrate-binding protein
MGCGHVQPAYHRPMVERRSFLTAAAGGLFTVPASILAQPFARIGYLNNSDATLSSRYTEAFREGLSELGWVEGRNLTIDYRWASGKLDQLPALASELVKVATLIHTAGPQAVRAARQASTSVPIVAAIMPDPVALGFAASLARPGGTVTGLANFFEELTPKQLQLFKETIPSASRIVMLSDPEMASVVQSVTEAAAHSLGLSSRVFAVHNVTELDMAMSAAKMERADCVHVLPSPFFNAQRRHIADLAAKYRLFSLSEAREYVEDGGLMSYGPNFAAMYRRSASFVDRILKGAKPGDLPIERPTKIELVINLKTARALGVTIPQSILLRADEIVQ